MTKYERGKNPESQKNLAKGTPFSKENQPSSEAKKAGWKKKATMQEMLKYLLAMDITNTKGETKNTLEVIMTAQIKEAIQGNTKAAQFIRDTIGEQPSLDLNIPELLQINVINKKD